MTRGKKNDNAKNLKNKKAQPTSVVRQNDPLPTTPAEEEARIPLDNKKQEELEYQRALAVREAYQNQAQFVLAMKGSVDSMSSALGFWWRLTPTTWFPSIVAGALEGIQEELFPIPPKKEETETEILPTSSSPSEEETVDPIFENIPQEDIGQEKEEVQSYYSIGWNRAKNFTIECAKKQWKTIHDAREQYKTNEKQVFEDEQKMGIFSKDLAFEAKQALSNVAASNGKGSTLANMYCYATDAMGAGGAIVSGLVSGTAHAAGRWATKGSIKAARAASSWASYLSGVDTRPAEEVSGYFSALTSSMIPYIALSILAAKILEEQYNKTYFSPSDIMKYMMEGFAAELALDKNYAKKTLDEMNQEAEIMAETMASAREDDDSPFGEVFTKMNVSDTLSDIVNEGINAAFATNAMILDCNMGEIEALSGRKENMPTMADHKSKKFISPESSGIVDTYNTAQDTYKTLTTPPDNAPTPQPYPFKIEERDPIFTAGREKTTLSSNFEVPKPAELPKLPDNSATPQPYKSKPGEKNVLFTVQDGVTSTDYVKLESEAVEGGKTYNIKLNPEIRAELVKLVAQNEMTEYTFKKFQTLDAASKGLEGGVKGIAYAAGRELAKATLNVVAPIPEVVQSKGSERG